eukprot:Awhi_evm1s10610
MSHFSLQQFTSIFFSLCLFWSTTSTRVERNVIELLDTFEDVIGDFSNGIYRTETVDFAFDFVLQKIDDIEALNPEIMPTVLNGQTSETMNRDTMLRQQTSRNFSTAVGNRDLRIKQSSKNLPEDIETLVEQLLLRKEGEEMAQDVVLGGNFIFVSWVAWYFTDTLNTKQGSNGATMNSEADILANIAQLYGTTPERESVLRSFNQGKLRTSQSPSGEMVPLLWNDTSIEEQQAAKVDSNVNRSNYVLGRDSLNNHWGSIFWSTIYTLEHNRICDELIEANPEINFTDERLFQMARVIMTQKNARIALESYASDFFIRTRSRLNFNSKSCLSPLVYRPNLQYTLEYKQAYTFHQSIPDYIDYNDADGNLNRQSLVDDIFRQPQEYTNYTLQEHFDAFYRTPSGSLNGPNIPRFLAGVTVKQIRNARLNGLASYNDFRKFYGYEPLTRFEQLVLPSQNETASMISEFYESIDDVDLHVGMLLGNSMDFESELDPVRRSIILHEITPNIHALSCYKDAYLYSEEFLTARGHQLVDEDVNVLNDIMIRANLKLPDNTPMSRGEPQNLNAQAPSTVSQMSFQNINDYNGLEGLWDFALDNDEFHELFLAIMTSFVAIAIFYSIIILTFERLFYKGRSDARIMSHYFVFGAIYFIQLVPYTYIFITLLFSDRFEIVSMKYWYATLTLVTSHAVLYIGDIVVRKASELKFFIILHHLIWFATLIIPLAFKNIFVLKIGVILDYFSIFEVGLFALLYWSKLQNRVLTRTAQYLGMFGVLLFIITRFIQTGFLIYILASNYDRMIKYEQAGFYAVGVFLSVIVSLVQLYTIYLYYTWDNLWPWGKNFNTNDKKSKNVEAILEIGNVNSNTSMTDDRAKLFGIQPNLKSSLKRTQTSGF